VAFQRGGDAGVGVRQVVELVDDLDGGVATETVRFALDGVDYRTDLSAANAAALREVLRRYAEAGRRVTRARNAGTTRRPRRAEPTGPQLAAVPDLEPEPEPEPEAGPAPEQAGSAVSVLQFSDTPRSAR
jgi:Lsr2